jgi:hypothetical protein
MAESIIKALKELEIYNEIPGQKLITAENRIKTLKEFGVYKDLLKRAVLTITDKFKNNELPVNDKFPDDLEYTLKNNRARFKFLTELFPVVEKLEKNEEVSVEVLEGILNLYAEQSNHNCFNEVLRNEKFKKPLYDLLVL